MSKKLCHDLFFNILVLSIKKTKINIFIVYFKYVTYLIVDKIDLLINGDKPHIKFICKKIRLHIKCEWYIIFI